MGAQNPSAPVFVVSDLARAHLSRETPAQAVRSGSGRLCAYIDEGQFGLAS